MAENNSPTNESQPVRRQLLIATVLGVLLAGIVGYSIWVNWEPPFSQQQYDDGYMDAFRMNAAGPASMDFRPELWSMQKGFDDAMEDFSRIYQHPNVGPFSYSKLERFREVLSHIESTNSLDPDVKNRILAQLRLDLSEWESQTGSLGAAKAKNKHDSSTKPERLSAGFTLSLNLPESTVAERMVKFGASDVSSGMQVRAGSPKANWMWKIKSPNLSIETLYEDGLLKVINVWDWKDRKQTSYQHTLEYFQVEWLVLRNDGSYQSNIVKTFNAGEH